MAVPEQQREPVLATPGEVLELVRTEQAHSRSDLARLCGMSRTAIAARVSELIAHGWLLPGEELVSTGGRPASGLVFNRGAGVVAAAAIGRSRSQLAVFDLAGEQLAATELDNPPDPEPDQLVPEIAVRLRALLPRRTPLLGIGLSLPCSVDPVRGVSIDSAVLRSWDNVDLAPYLARLGADVPLLVGNDANVLARSESLSTAAGHLDDVLVVKASTGLGLGVIAGGRVVTGHLGGAGEIGHTKVEAAAGNPCRCGDTGCLETIAGGWAMVARFAEEQAGVAHIRDLVALAIAGDARARALVRESGRRLGEVLAVAINLLNPEAVVIGGDMAAAFDVYAAGVRESVYGQATALATRDLRILPSTYGDRAGVVGCASMALEHVLSPAAVDARLARG